MSLGGDKPPNTETKVEIRIIPDPDETAERRKNLDLWRPELSDQPAGLDKLAMRSIFQQVCWDCYNFLVVKLC